MSLARTERLRAAHVSVRKTNRKDRAIELSQGRRLLPVFFAALMFIMFALVFVWSNHQAVQVGYTISELHKEHSNLIDLNRKYKVELANLTALDRLEHLAVNELGLAAPRPEQIQVIE